MTAARGNVEGDRVKKRGKEREEYLEVGGGKTRTAVLFRVIATRTEASKGFVLVPQLGSVRWIALLRSFMHAFFLKLTIVNRRYETRMISPP